MIFPPKLQEITILAKDDEKPEVIRQLHKLGTVHIQTTPAHKHLENDTSLRGVDEISNALLTLNYLAEKTETKKTKVLNQLPTPVLAVTEARALSNKYLPQLEKLLEQEKHEETTLQRAQTHLQAANNIPFQLHKHADKEELVLKSKQQTLLKNKHATTEYKKHGGEHYIKVTVDKQHKEQLHKQLHETTLKHVDTSWLQTNLEETKQHLQQTIQETQAALAKTRQQRKNLLVSEKSTLQYLITSLENHYNAYTLPNEFKKSKHFFVISGYCEEKDLPAIKQALPNALITNQPASNDAPTKLKNNSLAKQFQPITELFSTPKYKGIDPTILVTLFFPLFFGLMLADIGYGLLLLLATIPLYQHLEANKKWPATLLAISATSAILGGLIFGSFFGELIDIPALYAPSFEATMPLLYLSLALGATHLNLAVLLHIVQGVRREQPITKTVLSASPLLLIQATALAYIFHEPITGHVLAATTAATLIYNKGAFGLLDISGLIGNWFSYARILAVSLATSGVALAVNTIADKALTLGGAGVILWLLILLFGHAFNLVVSTIGAGINAARLHYVEFFNLFFATGGDAFTPFKRTNYQEVNTLWSI